MMANIEEWVRNKEAELFDAAVIDPLKIGLNSLLNLVPDIVGYTTLAAAAFVSLNAMIGRNITGPLGFIAGTLIVSTSVLAVV